MDIFSSKQLKFERKFWKLFGAEINVRDEASGQPVGYIHMKAFKLKEDIRLYTDSTKTAELLHIKARSIIDFGTTYDVFHSQTEQLLFSVRRKGLRSTFVRDKWLILDASGQEVAQALETGIFALLRRYMQVIPYAGWLIDTVFFFMKVDYEVSRLGSNPPQQVAVITRQKNPFLTRFVADTTGSEAAIDPEMIVAITTMLSIMEYAKN
jgi:hypothetical protein